MGVTSLLSLLEACSFREREGMFIFGVLSREGFSCKSFFRLLMDPSPIGKFGFDTIGRIKNPKKIKFLSG